MKETFTEFKFKKNTSLIVHLVVGDNVTVSGWGPQLDGKKFKVLGFEANFGGCESGIMVKISGYDSLLDSGWLTRI